MNVDGKINDIILITERLTTVLERENAALKEHRNTELHELLDDKVTLSRVYETRMQYFSENPDALKSSSPEAREKLQKLAANINELLTENAMLLKVAIDANRKVVEIIAAAVKNAAPGAGTYGSNGITGLSEQKSRAQGAPLTFDQTL